MIFNQRVMLCSLLPSYSIPFLRTVPGYCCFLDGNGEVVDFIRVSSILKRRNSRFEIERVQKVILSTRMLFNVYVLTAHEVNLLQCACTEARL